MSSFAAQHVSKTGRVALVAAIVVGALAVRVVAASHSELRQAEQSLADQDADAALVHLRRAARWYAPGSPYHGRALQRLAQMGSDAEQAGNVEQALMAYRSVRNAILATRSLVTPAAAQLDAADQRIAELMSELPAPAMDAHKTREQRRAEHLSLLKDFPEPSRGWTLVLLAGFVIWIGGAVLFILRAVGGDDQILAGEARRWGSMIGAGLAMFILGLVLV